MRWLISILVLGLGQSADFRRKFALVSVWHTFEARTVDVHSGRGHDQLLRELGFPDLREVQRFYDRAKGTSSDTTTRTGPSTCQEKHSDEQEEYVSGTLYHQINAQR
jgi:hypothetical protein